MGNWCPQRASSGKEDQLTRRQTVRLAASFPLEDLAPNGPEDQSTEEEQTVHSADNMASINLSQPKTVQTVHSSSNNIISSTGEQLTRKQIVLLAAAIATDNMAAIAEGYLDISDETVKNFRHENRGQAHAFNRDILKCWSYKNPDNQVQRLRSILLDAAREYGYVDPAKVCSILSAESTKSQAAEVSWREFEVLSESLKPYTEQAMKIEVAPWIREYVVNMDDLYADLTLEKVHKKLFGEELRKLENYSEIFGPGTFEYLNIIYYLPGRRPTRRILFKGDPGIGKTTLMKKIAFDWATKNVTNFTVVLVVFLKLVKPGESIENVIINQTPELEGMNVTPKKLRAFLKAFGNRCLLILDGLDEHALGQNEDVLKIIRGQKLLHCNVIISSRSHSTRDIEKHCQTVVRVNGFTKEEAEKFAFKILEDYGKVHDVLNFSPVDFQKEANLYNVPILLSFICLLVKEEDIDLSSKSLSSGEIYMRMVRCLYKKFSIRVGIEYQNSEFIKTLEQLGELAFETLLSGNPLMRRRDVLKRVGDNAFNFGLLIGHEDGFLLLKDETADILVTFPHRSIQEFLGAFFFIFMVSKGETIESLLGVHCAKPIFMVSPLFLHFCLWLTHSPQYFPASDPRTAYEKIRSYVLTRIDFKQLHLVNTSVSYPALDFPQASEMKDKVTVTFLEDLLANCKQTRHLVMSRYESIKWTLKAFGHLLSGIKSIYVWSGVNHSACRSTMLVPETLLENDSVYITLKGSDNLKNAFDAVIHLFPIKKVSLTIVLDTDIEVDPFRFLHKELKEFCIISRGGSEVTVNNTIPSCPSLTHPHRNVLKGLSDAADCPLLSELRYLSVDGCIIVDNLGYQN